mmetsp:Transcript_11570/g.32042  ORF Transcript_11570/g.32042 Transcript_11570/m.32042 type:complete len:269 (+) Transcript_11570:1997-2803(+)
MHEKKKRVAAVLAFHNLGGFWCNFWLFRFVVGHVVGWCDFNLGDILLGGQTAESEEVHKSKDDTCEFCHVKKNSELSIPAVFRQDGSIVKDGTFQSTQEQHGNETVVGEHEACGRNTLQASSSNDGASAVDGESPEHDQVPDVDNNDGGANLSILSAFVLGPHPPPRSMVFQFFGVLGLVVLVASPLPPSASIGVFARLLVGFGSIVCFVGRLDLGVVAFVFIFRVGQASSSKDDQGQSNGHNGHEGPHQEKLSIVVSLRHVFCLVDT